MRNQWRVGLLAALSSLSACFHNGPTLQRRRVTNVSPLFIEVDENACDDRVHRGHTPAHLPGMSRREWFLKSFAAIGTGTVMLSIAVEAVENSTLQAESSKTGTMRKNLAPVNFTKPKSTFKSGTSGKKLAPVNLTRVVAENKVNVTLVSDPRIPARDQGCITVDHKSFSLVKKIDYPDWVPQWMRPQPRIIRKIPNSELLEAAIIAGSATETVRTTLLYPLSTIKSRVQAVEGRRRSWRRRVGTKRKKRLRIKRRLQVLKYTFLRKLREGNLYAGILPSILVSVPCSGVYYGVRDITKRMLTMTLDTPTKYDDIAVSLVGALVADVVSRIVRTPADVLAVRLQVGRMNSEDRNKMDDAEIAGDWFGDAIKRLPASILTDLPYLLTRIACNGLIARGDEGLGRYELIYVSTACICAVLTTPFDVARTRILVDSNDDPTDGIDGGSGEGLLMTMQTVMHESEGGVRNLFRGWFERLVYLGIVVAWLQPFVILSYVGIRDAVLLEWFQ